MTVSTESNITAGPYIGNGTADSYSYNFRLDDKAHVKVFETDTSSVTTELTVDTDYTVNNIGAANGTITRVAGNLPVGYTWFILRDVPETQLTEFSSQGGFFPDVHEDAFDKLTILSQQQQRKIDRSVKLGDGDQSTFNAELPTPTANHVLQFNSAGNAFTSTAVATPTDVSNLQSQIDSNDTDISNLQSQVSGNASSISGLQGQVNSNDADITSLQNQVNAIDAVPVFDTLADLIAASVTVGNTYRTLGRNAANDGGGNEYSVTSSSDTVDGGRVINHSTPGLQLKGLFPGGRVSIRQFAYGAAAATNGAALVAALEGFTDRDIIVPVQGFTFDIASGDVPFLMQNISRIDARGDCTINIPAGDFAFTEQIAFSNPKLSNITINGASTVNTTLSSFIGVTGTARDYRVTLGVVSSSNIAVGDYCIFRATITGTGDYDVHAGVWRVTAVDSGGSNRITVRNTCYTSTFPTTTVTGGQVVCLKTKLTFTGSDGLRFEAGTAPKLMNNFMLVGDFDVADGSGTHGTHGIVTASPLISTGGSSNVDYDPGGFVRLGVSIGIANFGEQGVAISGRGHMVSNFIAACSNRKRGIYAEGGHIRCKFCLTNGNGEDGIIADTTGYISAGNSISSGNGLNGYWSTNTSLVVCNSAIASNNLRNGYESRGNTRLGGDGATARNNALSGFAASDGGMIDADNATSTSNDGDGFFATSNGIIDADNSTSTNNGGWGYESEHNSVVRASGSTVSGNTTGNYNSVNNSTLFDDTGAVAVDANPPGQVGALWWNTARTQSVQPILTSIGDMVIRMGSNNRYTFKANGVIHPITTDTQDFGRTTERWRNIYCQGIDTGGGTVREVNSAAEQVYVADTWTPTIVGSTITYTSQSGTYTRIGRMVFVDFEIVYTGLDTADTSNIEFGGLPLALAEDDYIMGQFNAQTSTGLSLNTDAISFSGNGSTSSFGIVSNSTKIPYSYNGGRINNAGAIRGTFQYRTSAS